MCWYLFLKEGATNMPETLDKALTRPGRFDRKITLPLPGYKDRLSLVNYYLDKIKIPTEKVNREDVARFMNRKTGADIKNLINQATIQTIINKKTELAQEGTFGV